MKIQRRILVLLLLLSTTSWAATFSLTPQVGYFFTERFPVDNGQVTIKPGFFVGGIASYSFSDAIDIELQYSRRNSPMDIRQGDSTRALDLTTGWLLINGCYTFENDAPAQPFLSVGMGWVRLIPQTTRVTEHRFAMDVGLGIKASFSDRVGMRLSANLLATMNNSAAFENEDGDPSYIVNTMTYVTQLGFRAGVFVKIFE